MKQYFLILLTFFLLFFPLLILVSCDKQQRTANKLEGEWEIIYYKLTDGEGLSEYATVQGSMIFENCKDVSTPCSYSLDISHEFPSSGGNTQQHGTFQVVEKGNYMDVTTVDASNSITSNYRYRILTHTKTDLQVEYGDSMFQIHTYIFKKKE